MQPPPGTEEPIRIVDYDPAWPDLYERERSLLEPVLSPWLAGPIEHIGSTAVPGLAAKPVLDIMAAVGDLPSSLGARDALFPLQYMYFAYRPDVMHWFCKPSPHHRTHHLHLVPLGSSLWDERLAFRDHLRRSDTTAGAYAALKRELAIRHRLDREAYTEAKSEFVRSVLERASRELP